MNRDKAEILADNILAIRGQNRWFLPRTRDNMILAACEIEDNSKLFDALSQILWDSEIDDPGSDPCDECRADRWFYFHPALVL